MDASALTAAWRQVCPMQERTTQLYPTRRFRQIPRAMHVWMRKRTPASRCARSTATARRPSAASAPKAKAATASLVNEARENSTTPAKTATDVRVLSALKAPTTRRSVRSSATMATTAGATCRYAKKSCSSARSAHGSRPHRQLVSDPPKLSQFSCELRPTRRYSNSNVRCTSFVFAP